MGIFDEDEELYAMSPPSSTEDDDDDPVMQHLGYADEVADTDSEMARADMMQQQAPQAPVPMGPPNAPAPTAMQAQALMAPQAEAAPAPQDRYAKMLADYQKLQDARRKDTGIANILEAAGGIGQAMAGSVSGKFDYDKTGYDNMRKQADMPVQDFSNRLKNEGEVTGVMDSAKMRDPNSTISQFIT